jgi:hypothetical protein
VQSKSLTSTAKALEAMKKAKDCGYRPPTGAAGKAARKENSIVIGRESLEAQCRAARGSLECSERVAQAAPFGFKNNRDTERFTTIAAFEDAGGHGFSRADNPRHTMRLYPLRSVCPLSPVLDHHEVAGLLVYLREEQPLAIAGHR